MVKIIRLSDEPAPSKNNVSRLASGKNNGNEEIDEFRDNSIKYAKKSGKLKGQNLAKSRKLFKSGKSKGEKSKKPSKSENSTNFNTINARPNFFTSGIREVFNCLRLSFIKAPIFWHFDPECHILIETDLLGYVIGGMLSQLAFGTKSDRVVTKTDLSQ